jgi:membrane protein insertase Oxa1/YidC/SpoIIIJ
MAVQSLKPRIDMMKARYGDDQAKIKRETNFLYEQAGVNPLAGAAFCRKPLQEQPWWALFGCS